MNTAHARSMPRVVRAAVRTLRWLLVAVLGKYFIENFMILVYDQRVGRDAPRLVLQKVPYEFHPKVRNHGEGPY